MNPLEIRYHKKLIHLYNHIQILRLNIMIKLKNLLLENSETNTFQMYHGGKRWSRIPSELYSHKQGRYECGVGIYLTNDYNTARKYAKGSRVVHLVEVD